MKTFTECVLDETAKVEDVDSWIDYWHTGNSPIKELHEFLGLTKEEYAIFVEKPGSLQNIIICHILKSFGAIKQYE